MYHGSKHWLLDQHTYPRRATSKQYQKWYFNVLYKSSWNTLLFHIFCVCFFLLFFRARSCSLVFDTCSFSLAAAASWHQNRFFLSVSASEIICVHWFIVSFPFIFFSRFACAKFASVWIDMKHSCDMPLAMFFFLVHPFPLQNHLFAMIKKKYILIKHRLRYSKSFRFISFFVRRIKINFYFHTSRTNR